MRCVLDHPWKNPKAVTSLIRCLLFAPQPLLNVVAASNATAATADQIGQIASLVAKSSAADIANLPWNSVDLIEKLLDYQTMDDIEVSTMLEKGMQQLPELLFFNLIQNEVCFRRTHTF